MSDHIVTFKTHHEDRWEGIGPHIAERLRSRSRWRRVLSSAACRMRGHIWKLWRSSGIGPVVADDSVCVRCGGTRTDVRVR